MAFEEFKAIYGEPKAEWVTNSSVLGSVPLRRFLMHVFAPDYYHLKFLATDFHSNTFHALKSVVQLEDMRDSIGIGGSWSDFVDYIIASVKSEDVKLVLEKRSDSDGPTCAKLVAQKAKGMPVISISLTKLEDSAANNALENLSFSLFKALKSAQNLVVQETGRSSQLTNLILVEKDGSERIQGELGKRQKLEMMNPSYKTGASALSNGSQDSPDCYPFNFCQKLEILVF
eukprot:XP_025012636.1 uncharacterized protein LOC8281213 isoform X2 [Ricinus communis]